MRDIKLLRSANIPISYDLTYGGYRLRRGTPMVAPPVNLPPPDSAWNHDGNVCRCPKIMAEEIAALLLAFRMAGQLPESIVDACESALVKIMAAALPAARERALNLMGEASEPSRIDIDAQVLPLRPSG